MCAHFELPKSVVEVCLKQAVWSRAIPSEGGLPKAKKALRLFQRNAF
jgi:hypothetical protein